MGKPLLGKAPCSMCGAIIDNIPLTGEVRYDPITGAMEYTAENQPPCTCGEPIEVMTVYPHKYQESELADLLFADAMAEKYDND